MPTLTVPSPSTMALLAETNAFEPIAVALFSSSGVPGPALYPMKVLLEPVMLAFAVIAVTPALAPMAVLPPPVVLYCSAVTPLAVLEEPVAF